ncbi:MAG: calcium-binding protein, partial [Oscillospiraceae bacterium]|nr:calcium-binding protein [Oscillospiraceae bacterium]
EGVNSGFDKVVFGEGIRIEDISLTRDGNDMVLSIGSDDDSIRIIRQYTNSSYQVESFEFSNGTIAHTDISSSEFVVDVEGKQEDAVQTNVDILSEIYMDENSAADVFAENNSLLPADQYESIPADEGLNGTPDQTDLQVMILTENMSAFTDKDNVFDSMNITDSTDQKISDQLFVNSAV